MLASETDLDADLKAKGCCPIYSIYSIHANTLRCHLHGASKAEAHVQPQGCRVIPLGPSFTQPTEEASQATPSRIWEQNRKPKKHTVGQDWSSIT